MQQALAAAADAAAIGEVPVGAVVVVGGEVVAVAHNERETTNDPTAHAEVVALRRAAEALGSWRLLGADLYVTMEPCPMCAGALVNARLRRVVYGCDDPKAGAARTLYRLLDDVRLNHRVQVFPGVLAAECGAVLRNFFSRLRQGRPYKPFLLSLALTAYLVERRRGAPWTRHPLAALATGLIAAATPVTGAYATFVEPFDLRGWRSRYIPLAPVQRLSRPSAWACSPTSRPPTSPRTNTPPSIA